VINLRIDKEILEFYLASDRFALGKKHNRPKRSEKVWRFQHYLRKAEYYGVQSGLISRYLFKYYQYNKNRLGILLGFEIPLYEFGPGLRINHFGNIVINRQAKIGAWCDNHQGVYIGSNNSKSGDTLVPTIGDNVWIGPGVKAFGRLFLETAVY